MATGDGRNGERLATVADWLDWAGGRGGDLAGPAIHVVAEAPASPVSR